MLYLEARCLLGDARRGKPGRAERFHQLRRLCPSLCPGGVRAILAENLLATMLNLECASGNDARPSHSDIRKTAKLMCQFIPGTDFIHSGFSVMPQHDNLFGGGCFDAEDIDDYYVLPARHADRCRLAPGDGGGGAGPAGRRRAPFRPSTPGWASQPSATLRSRPRRPRTAATISPHTGPSPTWPRPTASWRGARAC